MTEIWKWMNNKKTSIGAALLLAALIVERLFGIWAGEPCPDWVPKLVETLQWLGGLFTGVGLTHKGIKVSTQKQTVRFTSLS